jgi:hypothetical protein
MSPAPPLFVEIYRPADLAELALLRPSLDQAGIHYFVKNEFAGFGARAGELRLMVRTGEADEARALIADLLGLPSTERHGSS